MIKQTEIKTYRPRARSILYAPYPKNNMNAMKIEPPTIIGKLLTRKLTADMLPVITLAKLSRISRGSGLILQSVVKVSPAH